MRARINTGALSEALKVLTRFASYEKTYESANKLLLQAEPGKLLLRTRSRDACLDYTLASDTTEPGQACISADLIHEMLKRLPDGEANFSIDGNYVHMREGEVSSKFCTFPEEVWPVAWEWDPALELAQFTLPAETLASVLSRVGHCMNNDDTKPALTGMSLQTEAGWVVAAATDTNRLFIHALAPSTGEAQAILPGRIVSETAKWLRDVDGDVSVQLAKQDARIAAGPIVLSSALIEGAYPSYRRALPANYGRCFEVDRAALLSAALRVQVVALRCADVPDRLMFDLGAEELLAWSEAGDGGRHREPVPITLVDGPAGLPFSVRGVLLAEGLTAFPAARLRIYMNGPLDPIVLRPSAPGAEDPECVLVIMPMQR